MLDLENVSKIYPGGNVALRNISIHIDPGEFVFIVGPSGAGKSTFIKMLFREVLPSAGSIRINDVDILNLQPKEIPYMRRQLGIIFQDYRLLPDRTVYDNVAFAMQVIEAPYRQIKRRVMNVLDLVGLRRRAYAHPNELSGNLDPETSREIMEIFQEINNSGTTIIMATHDKQIVDSMSKRVIAIENGEIVRDELNGVYGYESEQ